MRGTPEQSQPSGPRRFEPVSRLGQGGMGVVFEAVDRAHGTRVALKTLHHLEGEALARLKREFRGLQDLHHPNLVSLGELVEEQGSWFFTMELVHGSDFLHYLRAPLADEQTQTATATALTESSQEATQVLGPVSGASEAPAAAAAPQPPSASPRASGPSMDEARLRSALGQLTLGLQALHRAGKVHRDIKPSNILVTEQGRVVLLDFGILSDIHASEHEPLPLGEEGAAVGTASYMAPEQGRGERPAPAADWYSVGVLLYQALTGHLPFSGRPRDVLEVKQHMDPQPPQASTAGLPEDLCQLCMELLRRDPRQRPSGEEVLRRLGLQEVAARDEAWATVSLPFVGRAEELRLLRTALEDSRQAGGSVTVLVQGESGVGKSRLVRRFLDEVGERHPRAVVLQGRCYERESVPYKGVDGLVDSLARYLSGRGASEVAHLLLDEAAPLALLFPVLRQVPGFPTQAQEATGQLLTLRLSAFAALRGLFSRLSRLHPVVLWVDDLQWADRDSAALLDELLRAPGLLLVATLRQGTQERLVPELDELHFWRHARLLQLEGLPPADSLALVERLLQGGLDAEHARRLASESGGLPLFIDALVRFRPTEGQRHRPVRLQEALQMRIRHLEPAARQLLELLALADGPLPNAVVAHAAGLDYSDYGRQVASLRAAHFALTSGPTSADLVEVFHDRVRQAVLPLLERPQHQSWHARLALALEALQQGSAETVARHWRDAGRKERAAPYYLQAAQEAARSLAFSRQAALYQTVLALDTADEAEQRRLHTLLGEALAHAGRGAEAGAAFLTAAASSPAEQALGLRQRAMEQFLFSGDIDTGLTIAREVLSAVGVEYPQATHQVLGSLLWEQLKLKVRAPRMRPRGAQGPAAAVHHKLEVLSALANGLITVDPLRAQFFQGRYLQESLDASAPRHASQALGFKLSAMAMFDPVRRPRTAQVTQLLEAVLHECQDDAILQGHAAVNVGWAAYFYGDLQGARQGFERSLALLQPCQDVFRYMDAALFLGCWTLGMMGELAELERRLALPVVEARERNNLHGLLLLCLGTPTLIRLARGELARAREEAQELISLWTRQACQLQHFQYLYSELLIDLYRGEPGEALRRLEEALPPLKKSFQLMLPTVGAQVWDVRGRAWLMEAARGGPGAEACLRQAEADARRLAAQPVPLSHARASLLRAGAAALRGRAEQAVQRYREALALLDAQSLGLHAAAARLRLGELLGGQEGQALGTAARQWMQAQGVVSPEAMAAVFSPSRR